MIIDSHCHLIHVKDKFSISDVIENAKTNDIKKILNISTKKSEFQKSVDISKEYAEVYFTLGIHPHEASEMDNEITKLIYSFSENKKFIGIGEIGLDFFYSYSDKNIQLKAFEAQIEIAQELSLPIVIHMREAESDMIRILTKSISRKQLKGVIHCFTGSQKFSNQIIDLGLYISASGIITFKKSQELREIFSNVPKDKLLVETDSPYLSPEPKRGEINQPSNIVHTIKKLSELHEITFDEMCKLTANNFNTLFNNISET